MTYSAESVWSGRAPAAGRPIPWAVTLFSLVLAWPLAQADEVPGSQDMKRLLELMIEAQRTLNYSGTFVYLRDNHLDALSVSHQIRGDQELERLVSLSGVAREVRRDQRGLTCVLPDIGAVAVAARAQEPPPWPTADLEVEELTSSYQLHALGHSRVAGRTARVVGVVPKDLLRYGHRFYLDEETSLPLKIDLMDEQARPIEQIMFTSLELRDPASAAEPVDSPPTDGFRKLLRAPPQVRPMAESSDWRFEQLPPGFRLRLHNRWTDPDGKQMEHLILGDGLASLSLYLEPSVADGLQGGAHLGAVNAWGKQIAGYQVTAVGEVPAATVRQVVEGLHNLSAERP